jgi:hypothetical protein
VADDVENITQYRDSYDRDVTAVNWKTKATSYLFKDHVELLVPGKNPILVRLEEKHAEHVIKVVQESGMVTPRKK